MFWYICFSRFYATSDEVTKIQEYRWDKVDLNPYYYYCSGDLLKSIFHSFECSANSTLCNNSSHELDIEIYYSEIIHALTIAADGTIPKVAKSALKHYWSAALTDLKQKNKETYDLWVLCGRPRNGFMYELMKSAKYKFDLQSCTGNAAMGLDNMFNSNCIIDD